MLRSVENGEFLNIQRSTFVKEKGRSDGGFSQSLLKGIAPNSLFGFYDEGHLKLFEGRFHLDGNRFHLDIY